MVARDRQIHSTCWSAAVPTSGATASAASGRSVAHTSRNGVIGSSMATQQQRWQTWGTGLTANTTWRPVTFNMSNKSPSRACIYQAPVPLETTRTLNTAWWQFSILLLPRVVLFPWDFPMIWPLEDGHNEITTKEWSWKTEFGINFDVCEL